MILTSAQMNLRDILVQKVEQVQYYILKEALGFVRFLKVKHMQDKSEASLLSESSPGKDWLKPEEDEAWQDL